MGSMVQWGTPGGGVGGGYVAVPASGSGPGLVVIQEWWGLVPHILDVCDRFAAQGFVAVAPDLYDGRVTTEPDEAGKLMMTLNLEAAVDGIGAAADHILATGAATSSTVGVVGFCMGGGLAMLAAARRPDVVAACVPFYGVIPWPDAEPDWSTVSAPIRGHVAELDGMFGPDKVAELQARLDAAGVDAAFTTHGGTEHAFFNDDRPEVFDPEAAAAAWDATLAFLRTNVR